MEEVDEFGIPIKKQQTATEVDEFGIPIKKKVPTTLSSNPTTSVSSNGSSPTPPISGSGASPVRDTRGVNPKLSFLADVVSDLNPNAPKLQPGQSVSEWGKNLTDYAKQYPMVKDGEPYKKEEIAQRLRFKAQQRNKDFETFMDEKVVETADLPEYDQNIKLYRDYLAHNEPEKLRQFDEKRNYRSGLPYGIGNLSEEDRQRLDAEFYDKALENKQRYLNIKWNDLKSTIESPEFQRMLSIQQSTAQEIEAMNKSYQEGNLSEDNYRSNYEQLKNRFEGVSMQVDPVMARAKELRDVTQRNINEAEVWIKRYPLEAQRRLKEIADDAYDEAMYQVMPSQKAAANFTNQVGRGVTEFLANVVSLPQVFSQDDSYGATDRLADVSQQWANDINDDLFPIPKRMNENVVNKDFSVNWDLVFPKTVRTLTDMGIMAATGTPAGMVATSFAMNAKDYYDEGLAQGMKPSEASQFSVVMGTQQALLELVNPEAALLRKGLTKIGTQEAMSMLTKGVPMKEVVKQVAKSTTKNIAMENTQEILQNIGDMTGKLAANALTGSEFDFSDVERDMKETILLTTIVAGLSGGGIASTQNSRSELEKRALYSAIDSPEMLLAATQKAVSQGIMDEATATKINMTAGALKQNLDALPATASETERSEVVNALFDKSKLMEVASNENLDPAIKKVYEKKIGELDAAVSKIVSKYIPQEGVETVETETAAGTIKPEEIIISKPNAEEQQSGAMRPEGEQVPTQVSSDTNLSEVNRAELQNGEAPKEEVVTATPTEQVIESAQPEAVKEGITEQIPTTDEKRNEEGRQKRLLTNEAEVATNIPEAPPLTKVFVSTSGNTIEENEMGNLVVKGKRGGILTGKERNKAIREYRKEKMTGGKRVTSADLERDNITEPEAVRYIAENSTSPEQLLEMMAVVEPKDAKLSGKDSFIADNMDAISAESWAKFGDTNRITPDIKKNFIRKNGAGIDQIAQAASYAMNPEGDGTEITPKDVIDFVEDNQKGVKEALKAGNEDMKVLYDAFVSLTGRAPTRSMIADVKKEGADKKIEEDFGMEPEPQDFSVSDSPQMKKRRFTGNVMADKNIKGTTKAKITEDAIYYLEQKNMMSIGEANKIIDEVGIDDAIRILKDTQNDINGGVRSVLGQRIIKQMEESGNIEGALELIDWLTKKATDSGQFLQAFSLWSVLTPAGQIYAVEKDVKKQRNARFEKDDDSIKKVVRITKSVAKESINEAVENLGLSKKVGVRVNENRRSSPSYGANNKLITKQKYEQIKAKLKGKLFANPLVPELVPIALYHLEASGKKFADFATNLLDEFGSAVRPYIKDMYEAAKKELGGEGYASEKDMDAIIAESENALWEERAKKITGKFDRAIKTKNEKLFNEAVKDLQSMPNKAELWEKYKDYAASRLKNIPANLFTSQAREKPVLQNFTDELVRVFREKMVEQMPKSETGSTNPERNSIEIIADAFKNKEKYAEVWDAAQKQMREKFTEDELTEIDNYFGAILDEPFSKKQIERVVKDGLKSIDKKVADIARAHYTQYDATKKTLTDKLIHEADLSDVEAKKLADAISKEFDRIISSKKSEILDKMFKEKVVASKKVKNNLETQLEQLLNLGAFSDSDVMKVWAKANDYPELSQENYRELERLADAVVAAPDGRKKFRAIEDMLKYQTTIKGVNWKEVGMAVWYANVLSGYNTQLVNAVSTGFNVSMNLFVTALRNAVKGNNVDTKLAVKGLYDGFVNGLFVAKDALTTGYSPILKGKVEAPSSLEIKKFMGGNYNPANWLKFVRRVMVATDVVFFEAAKEMRAYQLASKMARDEGRADPDLDTMQRAQAILNKTDYDQKRIILEAEMEYQSELDRIAKMDVDAKTKKSLEAQAKRDLPRRIFEMTQQSRNIEIVEQASDFASRSTYNYSPEGTLGVLTRGLNVALNKLPLLRFFIPFTNIIANVANEQINYTPIGFLRAYKDGSISGKRNTPINNLERAELYTKAAIGTSLMTLTYILAKGIGNDDEPLLEITANGTGNVSKNYNLYGAGWQPYSFRIKKPDGTYTSWVSYQYTPLQVGLSMIGNLVDYEKYRGEKADDETALKKLSLAFSASTRTFLDGTFLSSLNDLLMIATNPFSEDAVSNFTKSLQNSAKSFAIPNLYTQSFKQVQASFDLPNKEVKETNLGWLLRDIPIAREMYKDQIDVLGNPVIPDTDKFFSGFNEDRAYNYKIVAEHLFNIRKPSIRTVKVTDPKTGEETFLNHDEYYLWSLYRGQYINDEITKEYKKNGLKNFDKDWGTELQGDATEYASSKIYDLRENK